MLLMMGLSIPITRFLEVPGERVLALLGFGWAGLVAISVAVFLLADSLRFVARKLSTTDDVDEGRRHLISRGIAGAATVTAVSVGASGVALAMSDPTLKEIVVPVAALPVQLNGFRIVQLSDIHFGATLREAFAEHLVERVNAQNPDLVAITGDLVDGSVADLGAAVQKLTQIKARHGIFFVTGNHEYYSGASAWVDALTGWGVRVLRNESVTLTHEGALIDILGVDDWSAKRFKEGHGYDFQRANAHRNAANTAILLSHQPKAIHDAAQHVDLVLSGHTHGGQIWPGKYLVKLVQPYVSGLHQHSERTWIYVHSGTGYWGPPVRVGVPAEIALVTLGRASGAIGFKNLKKT
jgi:predicted MPP superfamily phosphohydrolase